MTTKTAERCGELANIRYTWPGKDEVIACVNCAQKAANVANAIGLHLQLVPVTSRDVVDPLDWPICQQMKNTV